MQNLMKERKQPPVAILQQATFLQYIHSLLVAKDHQKRRSRCFFSYIFLHKYFLTILIIATEQLYWKKILCGCFRFIWLWLLIQGVCQISKVIFPDISLIFPWFLPCFPWFYIGPEQIPHTTPISDNLNTYHYGSLFKQTLAYLSKEVCFNFIMKKENQHLTILQNKSTQFWKWLIMWKHFSFS